MFALAIASDPILVSAPSTSVRAYAQDTHTGDDARAACLLAPRLKARPAADDPEWGPDHVARGWPWPLAVCANILARPGVRAALGAALASRLDFFLAGDKAREATASRRQAARDAAARERYRANFGDTGDVAASLAAWPRAQRVSDETTINHTGAKLVFRTADGTLISGPDAVEAAYRAVLVGRWDRVDTTFGWVRGMFGYPPDSNKADPTPQGVAIEHRTSWHPDGSYTHLSVLVPMDDEAREQFVVLQELRTVANGGWRFGAGGGSLNDLYEVAPFVARMTKPDGLLGHVEWTEAEVTEDLIRRWTAAR